MLIYCYEAIIIIMQNRVNQTNQIAAKLSCPVCEGQSLVESESNLATTIKKAISSQLQQGKTEQQILTNLQQSYGDKILLMPPVNNNTLLLWAAPLLILLVGIVVLLKCKTASKTGSKK